MEWVSVWVKPLRLLCGANKIQISLNSQKISVLLKLQLWQRIRTILNSQVLLPYCHSSDDDHEIDGNNNNAVKCKWKSLKKTGLRDELWGHVSSLLL